MGSFVVFPLKEQTQRSDDKTVVDQKQLNSPHEELRQEWKPTRESHVSQYRKSDDFSLKTINQNINDSHREQNENPVVSESSPFKQNLFSSTLKYSKLQKVGESFKMADNQPNADTSLLSKDKSVVENLDEKNFSLKKGEHHLSSENTETN